MRAMVTLVCPICGGGYSTRAINVRMGKAKTCSIKCRSLSGRLGPVRPTAGVVSLDSETVAVSLSGYPQHQIVLDRADLDWFLDFERGWVPSARAGAVYIRVRGGGEYLHRMLLSAPLVDHANRNTLDCRRANLRMATPQQNAANASARSPGSSRFVGVHLHKETGKWTSVVNGAGRRWYMGLFDSEKECAATRDAVAHFFSGEYARLNFPSDLGRSYALAAPKLDAIRSAIGG